MSSTSKSCSSQRTHVPGCSADVGARGARARHPFGSEQARRILPSPAPAIRSRPNGSGMAAEAYGGRTFPAIDSPFMRLVTFLPAEGDASTSGIFAAQRPRLGAVVGEDRILDFARADAAFAKVGMLDFLEKLDELLPRACSLEGMASELPREAFH